MAIQVPGTRLLTGIPLRFVRDRTAGHGRKSIDAQISLVPFIDFLIVLVVFLLLNIGAQVVPQNEAMRLPDGVNTAPLAEAPVIAIDSNSISLDGRHVWNTDGLEAESEISRIENLVRGLETTSQNWTVLHPGEDHPGRVIVQADANTDFRVLKKVLFSAAQAGYGNISFAVNDASS
jgi:biopolymer transport protein ExbD